MGERAISTDERKRPPNQVLKSTGRMREENGEKGSRSAGEDTQYNRGELWETRGARCVNGTLSTRGRITRGHRENLKGVSKSTGGMDSYYGR